jgi:hypothetical protein
MFWAAPVSFFRLFQGSANRSVDTVGISAGWFFGSSSLGCGLLSLADIGLHFHIPSLWFGEGGARTVAA